MNVLIIGGAGYIGSHTAHMLNEMGHTPVIYDNLVKGHKKAIKDMPFIQGNILDSTLLENTLKQYKIDSVIHFAAYSLVGESMKKPEMYYTNNVQGTLNLLNTLCKTNIKKLVFSSSASVYGEPTEIPVREDAPKAPASVYGRTKLIMENIMADYASAYGLQYIALRYFNACGAHPDGHMGEDHSPESHLIPLVLKACLGLSEGIKIFGTDYDTEDGTCIRDYIHVNDLAKAHILALEALSKGHPSDAYNLGSGSGFSVMEIIKAAEEVTGIEVKKEVIERRAGDPAVLVASSDKIKRDLGWQPEYTDIKEMIKTAWQWHKSHPKGYED